MNAWRYVVSRAHGHEEGEVLWEIRELCPSDGGSFCFTADPIAPAGGSFDELLRDIEHMRADADLEVLDLTVEPPRLVARSLLDAESLDETTRGG